MQQSQVGPEVRLVLRIALQVIASAIRGVGLLTAFVLLAFGASSILALLQSQGIERPLAPLEMLGWNGDWSFSSDNPDDVSNVVFWMGVGAALLGFLYQATMRALGRTVTTYDAFKASLMTLAALAALMFIGMTALAWGRTDASLTIILALILGLGSVLVGSIVFGIAFVLDAFAERIPA